MPALSKMLSDYCAETIIFLTFAQATNSPQTLAALRLSGPSRSPPDVTSFRSQPLSALLLSSTSHCGRYFFPVPVTAGVTSFRSQPLPALFLSAPSCCRCYFFPVLATASATPFRPNRCHRCLRQIDEVKPFQSALDQVWASNHPKLNFL